MTLSPGQKLGPYEIDSPAGSGGMGEVYKAKDTRLDRIVAIKVLPERTAQNEDMRARFEREAKTISSLNHPNICTLHDIGSEDGLDYLVMEYLEGETLSERIKKGPLPTDEAIEIGTEIADALDKAHQQGLIHRDLKPANIILTREGAKLLDFGLAKLKISGGVVEGISGVTHTTPLTGTGTIVGTIQYMAPEQLEGSEADARSDIFAFGAVLYQMVTGARPFDGKSQASLIAAIIERNPAPISSVVPMSPPGLDRLVKKCLEKDPYRRWQSARDLADELRWLSQSGSQAGIPAPVAARRKFKLRLGWLIASLTFGVAVIYGFMWHTQPAPVKNVIRFEVSPGEGFQSISWPQISPDGRYLAFKATDADGKSGLWVRPMNSSEAFPLNGTEGALRLFWSPDSRYLAFTVGRAQLKKVPINGGPAQLIGEFERAADGSWGSDGTIIFDGSSSDSLHTVAAGGGGAVVVSRLNHAQGEQYHAWPDFLPDGKHFLFLSSSDSTLGGSTYDLKLGDVDSDEVIDLFKTTSRVVSCEPGYLVYVKDKILLAQAFDVGGLNVVGDPIPIAENVAGASRSAVSSFDVSNEGTLVYMTSDASIKNELVWVDRTGRELSKIGEPARYGDLALSPDGQRLVFGLEDPQTETADLWMHDIKRGISSRFTFEEGEEFGPHWSPDGSTVYYNQGSIPTVAPYSKLANGTGDASLLLDSAAGRFNILTNISSDGNLFCFTTAPDGQPDIEIMNPATDSIPVPLVKTPMDEYLGRFSPDGNYLSYGAEETDFTELYLLKLDGAGGKWQISSTGVRASAWNPAMGELLYFNREWELMSVSIKTEGELQIGNPTKLFQHRLSNLKLGLSLFAVSADGQRFLLVSAGERRATLKFNVVLNWPSMIEEDN